MPAPSCCQPQHRLVCWFLLPPRPLPPLELAHTHLQLIKYGVVRLSALQADLVHWATLYCAGRLHKPVATLVQHPGGFAEGLEGA